MLACYNYCEFEYWPKEAPLPAGVIGTLEHSKCGEIAPENLPSLLRQAQTECSILVYTDKRAAHFELIGMANPFDVCILNAN